MVYFKYCKKTIQVEKPIIVKGYNGFTFDVSSFTSGVYFIKGITATENINVMKFVKL